MIDKDRKCLSIFISITLISGEKYGCVFSQYLLNTVLKVLDWIKSKTEWDQRDSSKKEKSQTFTLCRWYNSTHELP